MITSTPVGRWTWGRSDEGDLITLCLHDQLIAYSVLASHGLAIGAPKIRISVTEMRNAKNYLFNDELTIAATTRNLTEAAEQLSREVKAALRPGEIGGADAYTICAGKLAGPSGEARQDGLFQLSTSAFADFVAVDLVTRSDAWMQYDLKGRAQPDVHAANSPRLAAALNDLAEALGSETDPEDPTYYGKPTETGIENRFEDDGTPSDVWSRFEIPTRNEVFHNAPSCHAGYGRTAHGTVQYVPIRGEHGIIGYLWASDAENSASFEPRHDADEEGYKAGLEWLDRLTSAYERGLPPSGALAELTDLSTGDSHGTLDLASLRELAREG